MKKIDLQHNPKIASGFKTPDGYFEDFAEKMRTQLSQNDTKVVSINSNRKNWLYAAAAIFVIAMSIPVYNALKTQTLNLDQLTLENYITNNAHISEREFAELLDEEDIQKIKINSSIEDKAIEDLLSTNANLEEYLIN